MKGETIMSTIMHDATMSHDEFNPTLWDDFVWHLGGRTNRLGEYVVKLGDRIQGNKPKGLDEWSNSGYAGGLSESLQLSFRSTGRVGGLLTAILKKSNLTTEGLAAKTKIAAGRVRELQDDAVADPEEVWAISSAVFIAVRDEEDKKTAEFYQWQQQARAAAKVRQAATV